MRKPFALVLALSFGAAAQAEPGLPDRAAVVAALDADPSVKAAGARTDAARAEADGLAVGPHEVTVNAMISRRTVRGEGLDAGSYAEFEGQVTRPIRLPGKAGLDRRIGGYGVAYARNMAEDARHQAALGLAQGWWDWLDAAAQTTIDRQAVANQQRLLASVERRAALRDASRLDADQARAALGMAQTAAARSAGREAVALARLHARYPGFALPAIAPDVPPPATSEATLAALHTRILGRSHELAAAQAFAARADAQAQRARRDRIADPSVGFRVFSDKGGLEQGGGLVLSIPLGGRYRRAEADKAGAMASAAADDLAAVRLTIEETADADLAEARGAQAAWATARAGLEAQVAALAKTRRGLELGAIDLADVLLAERQVHEAFRAEAAARADAQRALTRLRIDAHDLWINDEDDEAPASPASPAQPRR